MIPRLKIRQSSFIVVLLLLGLGLCFGATPLYAQNYSGITSPASGSYLSGLVTIRGTADLDTFWKYELAYKQEPSGDDAYSFLSLAEKPVINGILGVWDVSGLPPGVYSLRLRVVKDDANYLELYRTNLNVNLPEPPLPYVPMAPIPPQIANLSQPPRSFQLPVNSQPSQFDHLLPSPNYATDRTVYAFAKGQFLRSLDDGASWQSAAELQGAAIDWSQMPVALAKRSPDQVELLLASPSLLVNPFSNAQNQQRGTFSSLPFAADSPYAAQGNLFATDPSRFTWRDIKMPDWFVNEPWLLSHNLLGDLWATRLNSEETVTILARNELQNLLGAKPFFLLRAIPSPTGDAVALVVDTNIDADPDEAMGLQLLVLSLSDGNLRIVAPLQNATSTLAAGNAEAFVANRNLAVSLGSVTWAHDGKQLAFTSALGSDSADLYRFDLPFASIVRLSDEAGSVERIDWSADDSLLLYTVRHRQFDDISRTTAELYVANANGSGYRRLYNDNSRNIRLVDWTGPTSALIYNETNQDPCNIASLRKITIAAKADVGHTEFITETQVLTDTNGVTFTNQIQTPILVTTTEKLVMTEILTLTTEPFQKLGYAADRQEVLLAKGERCPGPNPKGLYRLSLNQPTGQPNPQFPQPVQLQPPQLISDQVYATRLHPLADGRWLLQESNKALGYLRPDNQFEPFALFTDTLPSGAVVTPQVTALIGNQWLWRLDDDPRNRFWIGEIGTLPKPVESPLLRNVVTSVDSNGDSSAASSATFAGINLEQGLTIFRYPGGEPQKLNVPREVSALQLVQPVPARLPLAQLFSTERWTIRSLPNSDFAIKQLLPSPNYALDGTLYLLGEQDIVRTTDWGQSWSKLAGNLVDAVPQIWLAGETSGATSGTTSGADPLTHRLLLASKRNELIQLDPARQLWQPLQPLPDWVKNDSWMLVTTANALWAVRNDSEQMVRLATIDVTPSIDPNPQDTTPAPSPFSTPLRSPDGKWLAFTANASFSISPSPVPVLYLLSLESGVLQAIAPLRLPYNSATFTGPDDVRTLLDAQGLAWSSDSRKLAFLREQVVSGLDLFVYDVDTASSKRLSEEAGNAYQMRWSPDNRYIVFTSAYSFGTGESYAMSGAWVADVAAGSSRSLYDLPPGTTGEVFVGWLSPNIVLMNSLHPLCGSLFLRSINVSDGKMSLLIPGVFNRVELNSQLESALSVATVLSPQCYSLLLALASAGGQPSLDATTVVSTLLQSDVITPGIYHTFVEAQAAGKAPRVITERVGGSADEGQNAVDFETLKATFLTAPITSTVISTTEQLAPPVAVPAPSPEPAPGQTPGQNLGWTTASFFDNGFNATIQLGDTQGQQINFQTDSTKQLIAAPDGLNAFLLTGNTTLRLQRLRYPLQRLDATPLITSATSLLLVPVSTSLEALGPLPSLVVERKINLPLLDGGLLALSSDSRASGGRTIYLASEQSVWRVVADSKDWDVLTPGDGETLRSFALADDGRLWLHAAKAASQATTEAISPSELITPIDPLTAQWQAARSDDSWLFRQPWQLLIAADGLWAVRNAGDSLTRLAQAPITDSAVITAGVEPFYQVTVAPDRRRIAWLSPLEPIVDGFQPLTMTLYALDLATQKTSAVSNVQLPNLRLAQEEKLLAWSKDGASLAFVSKPLPEAQEATTQESGEGVIDASQPITAEQVLSETVPNVGEAVPIESAPVETLPVVAAIGVFSKTSVVWHPITQGFPVSLHWAQTDTVVFGRLEAFGAQRPLLAVDQLDLASGESRELYPRPPESLEETLVAVLGERLIVYSQHPSCGQYNLRSVSLKTGEATPIWMGALRYVAVKDEQILVLPTLPLPECSFGEAVETVPTVNLYSLAALSPTLLISATDPIQGVYGESAAGLLVSTLDPNQLLQIDWSHNTIVTRTLVLPVPLSSFQQTLPGGTQWAGWNRGRSALWVGNYKDGVEGLPTTAIGEAWWNDAGLLATVGVEGRGGLLFVPAGSTRVFWVDQQLAPRKEVAVE